jgi:hypothetical protein
MAAPLFIIFKKAKIGYNLYDIIIHDTTVVSCRGE